MSGGPAADRRFFLELVVTTVLVVLCFSAVTFVRSQAGWRTFTVGEHDLTADASRTSGPLILVGQQPRRTTAELGVVPFEPGKDYLLAVRAGPGGPFKVVARHGPAEFVQQYNIGPRRESLEIQWLLDSDQLPEQLVFRAYYRGGVDVEVERLSVARLLPIYFWLRKSLPVACWLVPIAFLLRHRRRLGQGLSRPVPGIDATLALVVFGLCLFVFHSGTVFQVIDSRYLTAVSHSVMHGQGVGLPEGLRPQEGQRLQRQMEEIEGQLRPFYSPVPAILDIPFVAGYELFGVSPATPRGGWDRARETRIFRFSAAFLAAALCAVLYLIGRTFLPAWASGALAVAFAFGTQILSTMSRPYWIHTWGALLVALAILAALRPWRGREWLSGGLVVTFAGLAFACRPQTATSVVGLVAFMILARRWQQLKGFVLFGAGWAALGVAASLLVYRATLPSYFLLSWLERGRFDLWRVNLRMYSEAMAGMLVSPARGLFIYVPLYAWILVVLLLGWRLSASRPLALGALGAITAHLWLLAQTYVWAGGQSYGPRQLSDVVVWFFVLGALAVQVVLADWPTVGKAGRWMRLGTLALCLGFSVFVNTRGAFAKETWRWNTFDRPPAWALQEMGRPRFVPSWCWNWRYPQFMAGLLKHDLEEKLQQRDQQRSLQEAGSLEAQTEGAGDD